MKEDNQRVKKISRKSLASLSYWNCTHRWNVYVFTFPHPFLSSSRRLSKKQSRDSSHLNRWIEDEKKMWRKIFLAPFHKNIHFNSSPPLVFLKLFCYCASSCAFDFTLSIMLACWHLAHTYFYTLMPSMLLSSFH